VLVTGGAGFMGSNFVRYLLDKYPAYKVIVLDALTYAGSIENLPKFDIQNQDSRFSFWYGNVRNGELVDSLVSRSDVVVHFAAETHVTRSIYDNLLFFRIWKCLFNMMDSVYCIFTMTMGYINNYYISFCF